MKNCKYCDTSFDKTKNIYCSKSCYWKDKKGKSFTHNGSFKKGMTSWNAGTASIISCKECGTKYKKANNRGKYFCSIECRSKNKEWKSKVVKNLLTTSETFTDEIRKKLSDSHRGDKSYLWNGGVTSVNKLERSSFKYRLWRKSVFERDNYTCQFCKKRGGDLEADHIKQFAYYQELRFDINNGRTLCKKCHKMTNTHSKKENGGFYGYGK